MAAQSSIEWTDSSWTPIRAKLWEIQDDGSGKERIGWHCEHASEGCRFCYAESINIRLGTGVEFKPGMLRGKPGYYGDGIDRPELFLDENMLLAPLKWKKPRKIFVCSMTDLFASFVPDEWIDRMFAVMALCPQHTFQVLTKRAERMRAYMVYAEREAILMDAVGALLESDDALMLRCHRILGRREPWVPLPNVWLGISAERQQEWDERKEHLRATPAAVRFASFEPLLGQIVEPRPMSDYLQWAIVGGESGRNARPMDPNWARSLRDQCDAAEVPYFFKQWGEFSPQDVPDIYWGGRATFPDHPVEGGWCFGNTDGRCPVLVSRIGKKAAGRLLDGVEHSAFPSLSSV